MVIKGNPQSIPRPRFQIESFNEIAIPDEPDGIIKGVLPSTGVAVIYGESTSGKSFLALDMALKITQGLPFGGRETLKGSAIYVAAEGANSMRLRIASHRHHLRIDQLPFGLIVDAPDLGNSEQDAHELIHAISKQMKENVRLIVVDTLTVVMAGADENAAKDMAVLALNCHLIADAFSCVVLIVHHTGKDKTKGARGSSVLRASADTELLVEKATKGTRTVKIAKQKDGQDGLTLHFELEEISANDTGLNTCVVTTGTWSFSISNTTSLSAASRDTLSVLHRVISEKGTSPPTELSLPDNTKVVLESDWYAAFEASGISKSDKPESRRRVFKRAQKNLENENKITTYGEWVLARE